MIPTAIEDAALAYLDLGFCPLPLCPPDHAGCDKRHVDKCGSPGKSPWIKWKEFQERLPTADEVRGWFSQRPNSNVGLALGSISGLVRVDVDGVQGDELLRIKSGGDLPETLEFTSGGSGRGLLFRIPEGAAVKTTTAKGDGEHQELRFQAKGAQTVLPPSIHPDGRVYRWKAGQSPWEIEAALAPAWLLAELAPGKRKQSPTPAANDPYTNPEPSYPATDKIPLAREALAALKSSRAADFDEWVMVGMALHSVDDSLLPDWIQFSRSCPDKFKDGECNEKWATFNRGGKVTFGTLIHMAEQDGWLPPWKRNGHAGNRKSRKRRGPPEANGDPLSPFHPEGQTDTANGRRVAKRHADRVRFCHPWGKWEIFDGSRWKQDDSGEMERLAKEIPDWIFTAALAIDDPDTIKFAAKSASSRGISAMLEMAKSEPGIPVQPSDHNRDPMLFNVANGTIDLRTGKLREARREDLITQRCPVDFDAKAGRHHFDRFLKRILNSRQTLIDYVQRLAGYNLTGLTTEQILAIFYGVGANGKSTLLNVFLDVMGTDYAMQANRDLLVVKRGESHPTELASLFGRRLVVTNETDDGNRFDEAMVKQLTGSDKITARRMREDFWQFIPSHKLILATNHKPAVRGTDHAIWRRLRLIPFDVVIPDAEQDKTLPEKLHAERAGILAWMVEGCLAWQREGLGCPDEVKAATAAYRNEQDVLAAFITDECITLQQCKVKAGDFYAAFREWCDRTGEHDPGQRRFGIAMTERGFERMTNNGTWYCGIALRADHGTNGTFGT